MSEDQNEEERPCHSLRQSDSHGLSPGQSVGAFFRNVETRVPWLFPATPWASGGPSDADERFRHNDRTAPVCEINH